MSKIEKLRKELIEIFENENNVHKDKLIDIYDKFFNDKNITEQEITYELDTIDYIENEEKDKYIIMLGLRTGQVKLNKGCYEFVSVK